MVQSFQLYTTPIPSEGRERVLPPVEARRAEIVGRTLSHPSEGMGVVLFNKITTWDPKKEYMTLINNLDNITLVLGMFLGVGESSPTLAKIAILLSNTHCHIDKGLSPLYKPCRIFQSLMAIED